MKRYITLDCSDGKETKASIQQMANDVDEAKRMSFNLISAGYGALPNVLGNQLRVCTRKWLAPPDPSTNHNIACGTHHKKTATWFFQGRIYQEWRSTGSLLWIHGKRLSPPLSNLILSDTVLSCSWFWEKCHLVRRFNQFLSDVTDAACQFHGDPRYSSDVQSRKRVARLFLL